MPPIKKSASSKFLSEDFDDFTPKKKKPVKRPQAEKVRVDVEVHNLSDTTSTVAKKKKIIGSVEVSGQSGQKIMNMMNQQQEARKQVKEKMLKNLHDIFEDFKADYNTLKDNEQKCEHILRSSMKSLKQSATAFKQKFKTFKELHATFHKRFEDIEVEQRGEIDKFEKELKEDITKFKEKLIKETKSSERASLHHYFMNAMQNNF